MNPGRSTVTFTLFRRTGTPSTLCGSGSLVTVTCAVLGFTVIAARTTTSRRLNGPAFACTTTARPNGAPLYGPVRYTGPDNHNGSEPAREATVAVPTRDASGHAAFCACASLHNGTPARIPATPGGSVTDTPPRSCSPSWRVNDIVNGLNAPANDSTVPAENPGANPNPSPAQPDTTNELDGIALGPDSGALHGSNTLVVLAVPHDCGFASDARGPPDKVTRSSSTGCWAIFANRARNWPTAK